MIIYQIGGSKKMEYKNARLSKAKNAKNDEFYTQLVDIENELRHYKKHFKNKTVFCNCDDPYESNFVKYFAMNFNALGLKKLIATCYATSPVMYTQLNLFGEEEESSVIDGRKKPYVIEITEVTDKNGDGAVDLTDFELILKKNKPKILKGDGDFRSEECIEFLKEADIVVTNPPFSLFREYIAQLIEYDKKFLIIGDLNIITYKEIFPLFQHNKMWAGYGFNITMIFQSPYENYLDSNQKYVTSRGYDPKRFLKRPKNCWYTNLPVKYKNEKTILYKHYTPEDYPRYDNYDAIEVPTINDIPCDYNGLMGVPISFIGRINTEQFEIVGASNLPETLDGIKPLGKEWIQKYRQQGGTGHYTANMKSLAFSGNGKNKIIFSRLIIRKKEQN